MSRNHCLNQKKVISSDAFRHHWRFWWLLGVHPIEFNKFIFGSIAVVTGSLPIAMVILLFHLNKVQDILANLSISVTLTACVLKYVNIFIQRRNIFKINDWLTRLDGRANCPDEQDHLKSSISTARGMFYFTFVLFFGAVTVSELSSLFSHGERLMYPAWYPFDWQASLAYYSVAHLHQFIVLGINILQNVSSDTFPAVYILVLTGHVRALNVRLRKIGTNTRVSKEDNFKELILCIEDHQLLVQYFHMVQKVISAAVFLQFFVTGIEACITAVYVFFVDGNIFDTVYLCIYFLCVILEIFLYCYYGNELISESHRITEAIYSCNWIDQDMKFKKILLIFMQSTQKDMTVIAGRIFIVSSGTFVVVLKSSYSLFAVLMRLT